MSQDQHQIRSRLSLAVLAAVYVFFNFRYLPNQLLHSLQGTLVQLLTSAPIPVGLTILVVSFLTRMYGERPPWDRIARIYFTFGIIAGFLFALNEYWEIAGRNLSP
jgi:hypothetical protein